MQTQHRLIYLTLKMLDDASETVAVSSDQHPLSLFDLWDNLFVPVRQSPGDGVLKTLTGGKLVLRQVGITSVLEQKTDTVNVVTWVHTSKKERDDVPLSSWAVTLLMVW